MRRKTMRWRLISVVLPITLVGFGLVALVSGRLLTALAQEQHAARTMQMLEQIQRAVEENLYDYYAIALSLQYDAELQEQLRLISRGSRPDNAAMLRARQLLSKYFGTGNSIIAVLILMENDVMLSYKSSTDRSVEAIKAEPWYQRFLASGQRFYLLNQADQLALPPYSSYMFSMLYQPLKPYQGNGVEMIYFAFRDGAFERIYKDYRWSRGGTLAMLDARGDVIGAADIEAGQHETLSALWAEARFGQPFGYFTERDQTISYYKCPLSGWTIAHVMDRGVLAADVRSATLTVMALTALVCVVLGAAVYVVIGRATRPLEQLTARVAGFAGGGAGLAFEETRIAECVTLSTSFDEMAARLSGLIRHVEEAEKDKARLKFAALQYQINPHFILNTISAIRAVALTAGAEPVDHALRSLARLLSHCLTDASNAHTLREEREYLKSYLDIIQIRYQKSVDVEIHFPEPLLDCLILKFLLQPLVENSFLHGFHAAAPGTGRISVAARAEGGALVVTVADNGCGMSAERIGEILSPVEDAPAHQFSRIGLSNVCQRLRIHYPEPRYRLAVASGPDGTVITLTLPLKRAAGPGREWVS